MSWGATGVIDASARVTLGDGAVGIFGAVMVVVLTVVIRTLPWALWGVESRLAQDEEQQARENQWIADHMARGSAYYQQADRLHLAALKYRTGKPDRGRDLLLSPETNWALIAQCAAYSPDPRARLIATLLAAPEGPADFVLELQRSDAATRQNDLKLLQNAVVRPSAGR